jgi:hypothetical protein
MAARHDEIDDQDRVGDRHGTAVGVAAARVDDDASRSQLVAAVHGQRSGCGTG